MTTKDEVREEIKNFIEIELGYKNKLPTKRIVDYFTAQFDSLLAKKREEIGKMRQTLPKNKCRNAENEMFGKCFDCEKLKGFNQALDECLSILT